MSHRPTRFTEFSLAQRIEGRRLWEHEGWSFSEIAARFAVPKGVIAGMSHRQNWARVRSVERIPILHEARMVPKVRQAATQEDQPGETPSTAPAPAHPSGEAEEATEPLRPRSQRPAGARDRSTAERSLDTILGHARAQAAPPVLTAPMATAPMVHHRTCQWPHGEPRTPAFRFCGEPVETARPYCPVHCHIAYARPGAERGDAA